MLPDKTAVLSRIRAMPDLPSPSETARRIIHATQVEGIALAELEKDIRVDPAFVARLIRVANSSRHNAAGRPVVAIKDALMILGLPAIRGLALGFSLLENYRIGRCTAFDYRKFWLRSLAMAQSFQHIAQRIKAAPVDEAFSVGLLANIGELALASVFPDPYGSLLQDSAGKPEAEAAERETAAFGCNRWELSGQLLSDWGLPHVYALPVSLHRNANAKLPSVGSRAHLLTCALSLAADIADLILDQSQRSPEKISELYRHGARVSLKADELVVLGKQIAQDWQEWAGSLGLPTESGMDFSWVEQATTDAQFLSRAAASSEGVRSTVLLVDDERSTRMYIGRLLEDAGYKVIAAPGGKEALAAIEEHRPDLILTDWVMPDMDGLELIRQVRSESQGESLYILVFTAQTEEDYLVQAFDAGADDFITKPVKPRVLLSRLKAGERMTRLQRETERQYHEMRELAAELSTSNRRLQELSITDELTQCPNRRYALERLQQEWSLALRHGSPLSCLVVDIDWFKQVNDIYGHDRGDEVLKLIATTLRRGARTEDVVCRVGGDEFWIICPNASRDEASACGERLRAAVAALGIQAGSQQCTISIGVAERQPEMAGPGALIENADRNLYVAKRDGRGKVH